MRRVERHQVVVRRDHHDFMVTAVKRGELLRPRWRHESGLAWAPLDVSDAIVGFVVFGAIGIGRGIVDEVVRPRVRAWKVGVFEVRRTPRRTRWKVVHREVLKPDDDPARAVRRLADDVREGRLAS